MNTELGILDSAKPFYAFHFPSYQLVLQNPELRSSSKIPLAYYRASNQSTELPFQSKTYSLPSRVEILTKRGWRHHPSVFFTPTPHGGSSYPLNFFIHTGGFETLHLKDYFMQTLDHFYQEAQKAQLTETGLDLESILIYTNVKKLPKLIGSSHELLL